jgi:hypothetical protein
MAARAGVFPAAEASTNVLVVPRVGEGGTGAIVLELENRPGELTLPKTVRDILTAREYDGTVKLHPYQVMVLQTESLNTGEDEALAGSWLNLNSLEALGGAT